MGIFFVAKDIIKKMNEPKAVKQKNESDEDE